MIPWKHTTITVLTLSMVVLGVSATCGNGWFGTNCEYKCHCTPNTCDASGECTTGKCASGWFGPACQYQDLMSIPQVATSSPSATKLTDRDDQSCLTNNTGNLTVTLSISYPITWIRLIVNKTDQLHNITILFNDTQDSVTTCSRTVIQNRTMDIICGVSVAVNKISFIGDGVNSLCSLYISGGRNVALNQMTSQSSNYSSSYDSSRAVDGNTDSQVPGGSCTHTKDEIASNWNVTFSRHQLVNRYVLYNRNNLQERLLNFSLLSLNPNYVPVFSYSIPPRPQLIYAVTSPDEPVSFVKIFTNVTQILTLCEVEIYGDSACANKTFGIDCNKTCNCLNQDETCFVATGGCTSGCAIGYYKEDCKTECPSDRWGYNCNNVCSTHCRNNSCDFVSGNCLQGCDDGYTGDNCTQECLNFTWGLNCQKNCSVNCINDSCNNTNGFCIFGCTPGFLSENCSTVCPPLKWGPKCLGNCSINCANKTCDKRNGKCDHGCEAGYMGDNCTQTCPALHWGPNCDFRCSDHCVDDTCNRVNGTCDKGCQAGYLGAKCDDPCAPSKWGPQCKNNCSGHCQTEPCNVTNGWCDSGCETGYTPENCSSKCPALTWGQQCLNNCSAHCHNKTCDFKNGTCHHGCDPGYFGLLCLYECPISKWGDNCHLNCSLQCNNQTCSRNNGTCDYGCTSGYIGHMCLEIEDESTPTAAIVVPIVVVLILSVLVITAVFIVIRRRRAKSKANQEQLSKEMLFVSSKHFNGDEKNNPPDQTDRGSKTFTALPVKSAPENTYSNTVLPMIKDTSIAVNDLNEFMRLHKGDYFTEQFKNIPPPLNVSVEVGQSDANKHKNRYKNICTYDHSRVHLKIDTSRNEGDYINASYIEGYMDRDKFIASQGPNKIILNDFVRLLWEQKVDKVVMLTNLIEEGQVKCERYWPEEGKVVFGHIKVRLASTQVFADYTIRQLELRKKDEPVHQMTQFHFTSWPDKGVPLTPWSLVDFEQRVASEPTTRPVVVHCSAGVGRTGTFIALCNVMKEAEDTGRIDFYKTLVKLRQDRVMMIQTPVQYEFLHRAAQVAIVCMRTTVTSRDITERIRILEQEIFKGRTKMETEFQAVCLVSEDFTKHIKEVENTEQDESVYENNVNNSAIGKNRCPDILPEKAYSALLIPDGSQSGDYINAVIVPSLKKKDQQVLTQLPLATTVVDFWRLVMDYKVSIIVEFEFHLQSTDPTIADYLPSMPGESLTLGTNEIHILSSKKSALWEELQLSIRPKKKSTHLTSFGQLKVSLLKCFSTELDVKNLLLLVKHIRSCRSPGEERVLYMCRDGARYSGLACVLTLLLDRMDNDLRLTVPLVVGAIKSIRPQVIPTLDQYRILYQVLHRYNETTSSYTNFGDYQQINLLLATDNLNKSKFTDSENVYSNT